MGGWHDQGLHHRVGVVVGGGGARVGGTVGGDNAWAENGVNGINTCLGDRDGEGWVGSGGD